MKRILLIITILTGTFILTKAQSIDAKKGFNKTLQAYFDTKNALAKDDVRLANMSAKGLTIALTTFPVESLSATQQTVWKTQTAQIIKSADAIVLQKDLKEQRKSFWPLSSAMLKLAKELKLNTNDVYVQYCPMAKKSWLNEVEAVQNPFYGSMMYDCGEVTETIAKK
ncbi:DUF3347 domain-containing protein [Pedobacter sp. LMG 31464]|uniref:DUF3347 domain-containing protein n=1 Tax=Pedobacter planticolens TaxID=2679964 RepID=A0A923IVT9_9SPHI|nr:DUF3347 domain-containing protein [Pedobacter planticolens]MBB2146218.1 DUF3347 domain-containing protein [Pedobacter planticolens]